MTLSSDNYDTILSRTRAIKSVLIPLEQKKTKKALENYNTNRVLYIQYLDEIKKIKSEISKIHLRNKEIEEDRKDFLILKRLKNNYLRDEYCLKNNLN